MTPRYGIDTSVLVRLATGDPEADFQRCVDELRIRVEGQGSEVLALNQVIGEAHISLQHYYRISDAEARAALVDVLTSGLVSPLNGQSVVLALQDRGGPGLFDRLIADDYSRNGLETLTLDRRMATLPGVQRI